MKSSPRSALALLGLGFSAVSLPSCSGQSEVPLLLGEEADGLVFVTSSGSNFELEAHSLVQAGARRFDPERRPGTGLHLLVYSRSLEALGLPVGELALAREGGPIPKPDRIFAFSPEDASTGEFVELGSMPAEIDALRLAATSLCVRFGVGESIVVPDSVRSSAVFSVDIGDSRFLLGLEDRRVFVFGPEGLSELTAPISNRTLLAGAKGREGEVWLADDTGATFHGHPDRGFVPGPSIPMGGSSMLRLVSSPPSAEFELYAATSSVAVFRLETDRWSSVYQTNKPLIDRSQLSIAWLKSNRVALIGMEPEAGVEVEVGASPERFTVSLPLRPTTDVLYMFGWVEGYGALLGTRYSALFQRDERSWEFLPLPEFTPIVHVIIDLGDGSFLAGGESGLLNQWLPPPLGQCPPVPHSGIGGHVRHGHASSDGFTTVTDPVGSELVINRYVRL